MIVSSVLIKKWLLKGADAFAKESGKQLSKLVFSALFGKDDSLTKAEFERILRQELNRIAKEIKAHIDEAFLQQKEDNAILALRELESLLGQYLNSGQTSVDLLTSCTERATEALVAFDDIGASAIHHFGIAASLMVIVYEERAEAISERQKTVISNEIVPMANATLERMFADIERQAWRRVRLYGNPLFSERDGETVLAMRYSVHFDGKKIASAQVGGEGPAPDNLRKIYSEHRDKISSEVRSELDWVPVLTETWKTKYPIIGEASPTTLLPADFAIEPSES